MLEFRVLLGNSVSKEQVTQPQEPVLICNIIHCEVLAPHGLQHLEVSLMSVALLVLVLKTVLRLHQGSSYRSYEKLRQSGSIRPSHWLVQSGLSGRLAIKRTPREASNIYD